MKRQIRSGTFETNSSSMHAIAIMKKVVASMNALEKCQYKPVPFLDATLPL